MNLHRICRNCTYFSEEPGHEATDICMRVNQIADIDPEWCCEFFSLDHDPELCTSCDSGVCGVIR